MVLKRINNRRELKNNPERKDNNQISILHYSITPLLLDAQRRTLEVMDKIKARISYI